MKNLREDKRLRHPNCDKLGVGMVQSADFGTTVAGLLDVSVFCGVARFGSDGFSEVNRSWSLMMHGTRDVFGRISQDNRAVRVRPTAGDSLFVFIRRFDPASPGFKILKSNLLTSAVGMGAGGKVAQAVTSNGGSWLATRIEDIFGHGIEVLCVAGQLHDQKGALDPRRFWKAPPHIAFTWSTPTLGQVAQGVWNYMQQFGMPAPRRYVTTGVRETQPWSLVHMSKAQNNVSAPALGSARDDLMTVAGWMFG